MTTIDRDRPIVTLINVFSTQPADQQKVVDLLREMNETIYRAQPGYLTTNLHKSLDGVKVVNYSQWRTRADFDTLTPQQLPALVPYFQSLSTLCSAVEPHLYEVVLVDEAAEADRAR